MANSVIALAPTVCPIKPFKDVTVIPSENIDLITFISISSFVGVPVPCALMYTRDGSTLPSLQLSIYASLMAAAPAFASGSGAVI